LLTDPNGEPGSGEPSGCNLVRLKLFAIQAFPELSIATAFGKDTPPSINPVAGEMATPAGSSLVTPPPKLVTQTLPLPSIAIPCRVIRRPIFAKLIASNQSDGTWESVGWNGDVGVARLNKPATLLPGLRAMLRAASRVVASADPPGPRVQTPPAKLA